MIKTFGDRVRDRRNELELAQEDLAKAAGISQSTIAQIENGRNKGTKHILALARALEVRPEWLEEESGEMLLTKHKSVAADASVIGHKTGLFDGRSGNSDTKIRANDTKPGPAILGKVPLISWDQARTWDPLMHSFAEKDAERWLDCPALHSAGTFCLRNDTETMDDGTSDGYREGEVLFIDPAVEVIPGKDIIVILPDGKLLFRRIKRDSEGPYLLALNGKKIERWQEGTIVQGVVIFSGVFR